MSEQIDDLFIIGGGVNGTGIARDAAGRGLSVTLAEMGDLAQGTSQASTKLIHGGLRYLEYYEFRLVREALIERERLLAAMPHIAWPLRFVLPYHSGLRPRWLIRLGLFIYDHLGGRKRLPATLRLDLRTHVAGKGLKPEFATAFEYSDAWVQDARLVVLNARDAAERGARIMTRARVTGARREAGQWVVEVQSADGTEIRRFRARSLINAAGPWVEQVLTGPLAQDSPAHIRLVRGSHIVVPRLFEHDQPYILQGGDGRIVFMIPFEQDFTLIGTTEEVQEGDPGEAACSEAERDYLLAFIAEYLTDPPTAEDVVWTYAGVRPLYDDGTSNATQATRDYVLTLEESGGAPLLSVFGGKITTYRKLAEAALAKLGHSGAWTAGVALPGGDIGWNGAAALAETLRRQYPFLSVQWAWRLAHTYGSQARVLLGAAGAASDLGEDFGATLSAAELRFLIRHEFAREAGDVLWRRTKLGLRLTPQQRAAVEAWMGANLAAIQAA